MYEQISANKRNTWIVIIVFMLLVAMIGYLFGYVTESGYFGLALAVVVASVMSVGSFYYSDKLILSMSGAVPADPIKYKHLHNVVEGLSIAAGVPKPKLYVINDTAPNAMATGRDPEHAVVAVTEGLLSKLDRYELEGVIAHELSHIQNYDIRLMAITTVLVGSVALLSDWLLQSYWWGGRSRRSNRDSGVAGTVLIVVALVLAILAPIIAKMMQLALSRQREYLADSNGALLTRYPEGLAKALAKIAGDTEPLEVANKATANLYIVNPLKEWGGRLNAMFQTHPPIEERIERLKSLYT